MLLFIIITLIWEFRNNICIFPIIFKSTERLEYINFLSEYIRYTMKPLNTGHSQSLKFCTLFGGVR